MLFTFPSRYWFAIGLPGVFSLAGWSPRIRTGFLVPRPTQGGAQAASGLRVRGYHPLWPRFPAGSASPMPPVRATLQPRQRRNATGLGSSPFARRYWGNRCCFLLLRVLRCFSSPGLPPDRSGCPANAGRVAPFGHPRINGYVPLPADFRSLSRPSSPLGA